MATEYGTRLRAARKHAGLTQIQLSEATNIPQSTISTAEREGHGSADTPVYAKATGVDAHWLATGEGTMLPSIRTSKVKFSTTPDDRAEFLAAAGHVPLVSWVTAGCWADIADPYQPGVAEDDTWLPCPARHGSRTYCLRVRGESMFNPGGSPSYANGDIIFVDPDRDARPGDRVVVRMEDHQEATFKQLVVEDGRMLLKALNPEWTPRYIEVNGHATITGVVIGKWVPE